jgi:SAM-dependent methyltransferase
MPGMPPGRELLDDPEADSARVAESLRHIVRSNRWFGGRSALRWGVARALDGRERRPLVLLDLGTGAGDLPRDLEAWGAARGVTIRALGLERIPSAARLAARAGVPTILGSAGSLPVRPGSVDIVTISQLLHHLVPADAVALMREATRLARHAVVVADLRRAAAACIAFRIGAAVLRFDAHTRADGLTSIARGYTADELARLCAAAGVPARVAARPFFRLVAWWPTGAVA